MLLIALVFLTLMLLNMPIAFTIGISASLYFLMDPSLLMPVAVQRMVAGTQSFPLLAVPFFILAGHLMNASGVTSRLLDFADALIGHVQGGIAQMANVLSLLMAGLSGSSNADAAMETRMLMPKMRERGYPDGFSAAVLAYGSLPVAIIPPSIGLILYGFVGQVSIAQLFIAGIIPGMIMWIAVVVATYLVAKKLGLDRDRPRQRRPKADIWKTFRHSVWALLFPILLVVTIRYGIFTPTEVGAFAVVYTLVIGRFVHLELDLAKTREAFDAAVIDNGVILLIISMAGVLGYIFAYGRLPQDIASLMVGISADPAIVIALILIFLLAIGTIMEGSVIILLLTPIFLPIVQDFGMDPVHFGIIMAIVVQIGGVTPPVGVNMFTVCSVAGIPIGSFLRSSPPFLLAILVVVALVTLWPDLSLLLPRLLL